MYQNLRETGTIRINLTVNVCTHEKHEDNTYSIYMYVYYIRSIRSVPHEINVKSAIAGKIIILNHIVVFNSTFCFEIL